MKTLNEKIDEVYIRIDSDVSYTLADVCKEVAKLTIEAVTPQNIPNSTWYACRINMKILAEQFLSTPDTPSKDSEFKGTIKCSGFLYRLWA